MKKIVILCIVFSGIVMSAMSGYGACSGCAQGSPCAGIDRSADTRYDQDGTMLKKLGRGICNAITFPAEIFLQMGRISNSDGPMAGSTWGLLKGIGMAGTRAAVGIYEIVTFPIPCPAGYQPILTDPEFFFEDQNW